MTDTPDPKPSRIITPLFWGAMALCVICFIAAYLVVSSAKTHVIQVLGPDAHSGSGIDTLGGHPRPR